MGKFISLTPLDKPVYLGVEVWSGRGALNREMHFILGAGYRVLGKEYLSQIKIGDIINVGYDEIIEKQAKGKKNMQFIARTVELNHEYRNPTYDEKMRRIISQQVLGVSEQSEQ